MYAMVTNACRYKTRLVQMITDTLDILPQNHLQLFYLIIKFYKPKIAKRVQAKLRDKINGALDTSPSMGQ